MANTSKVRGLRPISQPYGNIQVTFYKAETDQAIYLYQNMSINASGRIGIAHNTMGQACMGPAVSILGSEWGIADKTTTYLPANTDGYIGVCSDPNQYYVVEEDTGGSALTAADIGAGGYLTYLATTGNTTTGVVNMVLDRSTVGTNSGSQVRLIKLWDKPDNAHGDNAKWVVQIQNHQMNPSALTPTARVY